MNRIFQTIVLDLDMKVFCEYDLNLDVDIC